ARQLAPPTHSLPTAQYVPSQQGSPAPPHGGAASTAPLSRVLTVSALGASVTASSALATSAVSGGVTTSAVLASSASCDGASNAGGTSTVEASVTSVPDASRG